MNRIIFLFFLSILTIVACQKENIDETTVQVIPTTPTIINLTNGDVTGKVIDESGAPIVDVRVNLGNKETFTNQYGLFLLEDAELNSQGTYVKVTKAGYFHGSRTFIPASEVRQNVIIQLLEKTSIGSFQSSTATVLEVEQGTTIAFQAEGIIDANGNSYTGEVSVAAKRIDPLAENLADIMPGNLTGINADLQPVVLATYGMLAVELETPSGENLQLAPDRPATIIYQIPPALIANAPQTIPLWYFDKTQGIWKEEGQAIRQGSAYVGEVAHFSFWNCDAPFYEFINLNGTVVYEGYGIENATVSLQMVNNGLVSFSTTDANGHFSGLVPTNETFNIFVYLQYECDDVVVLYNTLIGPFNEQTILDSISIDLGVVNGIEATFQVTGSLVDCDGNPVWGLIDIENENGDFIKRVVTNSDGTFDAIVVSCYPVNTIKASVISFTTLESVEVSQDLEGNIDFSTIEICNGTVIETYLLVYNAQNIYHTEENTSYRNAQMEYHSCADEYYFEISSALENEVVLNGIIGESASPIVSGTTFQGRVVSSQTIVEEITIEISYIDSFQVSGTFTVNTTGDQGSFVAPFNN